MCGIVGYVGHEQAQAVLIDGLKRLEYRGYDSAGIAVLNGGGVKTLRCEGKLHRLVTLVEKDPPPGTLGIGHTRWATHGRPSDANAHPHKYGRVSVVHNGIVENFLDLRAQLRAAGHTFQSETDSEVLAHLIDQQLQEGAECFPAVRQALAKVQGVYALCVLFDDVTDRFYCAKTEAPLILGLGEGEHFAASDIPAILHRTRQMVFLEDGDVAEVRLDGVTIIDGAGKTIERKPKHITWSAVMAEKEGYKHFMLKEIYEQPRAIADTLRGRVLPGENTINLNGITLATQEVRRIYLTACGTAYHACMVGKVFIETLARIPCEVDLASEFRYRDPIIGKGDLVIAVSQSGETADTRAAMSEAKKKGATVIAISNVIESSIARAADHVLYTRAGPEIGVASTKAFTTQLVALYLVALHLAQQEEKLGPTQLQEHLNQLLAIPHQMQEVLHRAAHIQEVAQNFVEATDWLYLGRGVHYPIALEGALKLKEISYAHAEGYAAGEMKHGPIALIDDNLPVVGVVPRAPQYDKVVSNLQEVKARGGHLIVVATEGDDQIAEMADHVLWIPQVDHLLQPLIAVLPLQLLAYYVADARGTDVDQPRNLAKSVTVE